MILSEEISYAQPKNTLGQSLVNFAVQKTEGEIAVKEQKD